MYLDLGTHTYAITHTPLMHDNPRSVRNSLPLTAAFLSPSFITRDLLCVCLSFVCVCGLWSVLCVSV